MVEKKRDGVHIVMETTTVRNWKMATEGGGRHSPSTVVWEEEGVLRILPPGQGISIGPKVTVSGPTAPSPGQMSVWIGPGHDERVAS
jgi:hypothetical protein